MSVGRVFPAVARDAVRASDAAGREHDCFGAENAEAAALTVVAERTDDAPAILEQRDDRDFHVHVDRKMDRVILQRADHFETRAIADMREARVAVAAEIALKNASV